MPCCKRWRSGGPPTCRPSRRWPRAWTTSTGAAATRRRKVRLLLVGGCVDERASSLSLHLRILRRRQTPRLLPSYPSPTGGRSAAQEQYCDQAAYYTGRHEACFELVRHHYTQDVATLKFGAADDAETEAAAAAAEAAAEAEAAVEDAAAEQRH